MPERAREHARVWGRGNGRDRS